VAEPTDARWIWNASRHLVHEGGAAFAPDADESVVTLIKDPPPVLSAGRAGGLSRPDKILLGRADQVIE
jgi:hypothetical protein